MSTIKSSADNLVLNAEGTSKKISFQNNGVEVASISTTGSLTSAGATISGDATLSTGNLVIGTAGKGIDFSADPGSTTGTETSKLLDDYETGTWTPGLTFGYSSVGLTFSNRVGQYTKVGSMVTASCYFALSDKGTATGTARVTELPFTSDSTTLMLTPVILYVSAISFADAPLGYVPNGTTHIHLQESTNAGTASNIDDTNFANSSQFMASVTYRV